GYYSAEINVGGKVIYGYNWVVRDIDEAPGFYRLTFSLDSVNCPVVPLNTFFTNGTTSIVELEVVEEEEEEEEEEETSDGNNNGDDNEPNDGEDSNNPGNLIPGGIAKIDFINNLSYMDVQILKK
ncbi:MAG: hypothetical protein MUO43_17265, partial [Desulfobacterales bacterium]|nr:hypothetical protein [Desulfobacterales bacterium]